MFNFFIFDFNPDVSIVFYLCSSARALYPALHFFSVIIISSRLFEKILTRLKRALPAEKVIKISDGLIKAGSIPGSGTDNNGADWNAPIKAAFVFITSAEKKYIMMLLPVIVFLEGIIL
jgi:hypothetical protein